MNINDLYLKVGEFEAGISSQAKSLSNCKNGCSRCCYVDLSVFSIEADNIKAWYLNQSQEKKEELKKKWESPLNQTINFHGDQVNSCTFLHQESCTIYEARPLICRTQGLAFKFKDQQEEFLDICPLNEEMLDTLKDKEILNLDLLNMILSQLEKTHSQGEHKERRTLKEIRSAL